MSNISNIPGNSVSPIGEAPLRAGSSFSRPAALIGGATALIALTAIATTLAVKSPQPEAATAGATAAAVAAQSLAAEPGAAKIESKAEANKSGDAAPADKPAPVRVARTAAAHPQAKQHVVAAAAPAACATCGVIESVTPFQKKGEGSGVGAVGGAVVGGLLGHQVGGGDGKKAMTVIGAVGGGFAGNEIEKRHKATTLYSVKVRMDDGSQRTLTQSTPPTVGQKVTLNGSEIRARG